jgi:hypothetical protein
MMTPDDLLRQMRAVLAATPSRWLILVANVPENLLLRFPAAGEWSAVDCLRHLRDGEEDVFQTRLRAFRAGQDLVTYEPARDGRLSRSELPAALAEEFARARTVSLALLADVTAAERELTVNHAEYGPVRLGEWLHYWGAHDLMHTVQAERALMQPFIEGAGPWRVMCADHDVAPHHG